MPRKTGRLSPIQMVNGAKLADGAPQSPLSLAFYDARPPDPLPMAAGDTNTSPAPFAGVGAVARQALLLLARQLPSRDWHLDWLRPRPGQTARSLA